MSSQRHSKPCTRQQAQAEEFLCGWFKLRLVGLGRTSIRHVAPSPSQAMDFARPCAQAAAGSSEDQRDATVAAMFRCQSDTLCENQSHHGGMRKGVFTAMLSSIACGWTAAAAEHTAKLTARLCTCLQ